MRHLLSVLPPKQKSKIRSLYYTGKQRFIQRFFSYGTGQLAASCRKLGVQAGDTLVVHSSFDTLSGFKGSPSDFLETILEVIGSTGNLLMVSLPYRSSTHEYLSKSKVFDVRKTVSQMGLISETFRRRPGVLRSLHPTHPVLAYGPKAQWLTANHEDCPFPCGQGTPFDKLAFEKAKALFFDVPLTTFTFFHHLEDRIKDRLPFPLYFAEPFEINVIDATGMTRVVKTYVFSTEANQRRRPEIFWAQMKKRRAVKKERVGNSILSVVEVSEAILCTQEMIQNGIYFYELG